MGHAMEIDLGFRLDPAAAEVGRTVTPNRVCRPLKIDRRLRRGLSRLCSSSWRFCHARSGTRRLGVAKRLLEQRVFLV
jgi:hypothetical protein